jgi:hypothetical protein
MRTAHPAKMPGYLSAQLTEGTPDKAASSDSVARRK